MLFSSLGCLELCIFVIIYAVVFPGRTCSSFGCGSNKVYILMFIRNSSDFFVTEPLFDIKYFSVLSFSGCFIALLRIFGMGRGYRWQQGGAKLPLNPPRPPKVLFVP